MEKVEKTTKQAESGTELCRIGAKNQRGDAGRVSWVKWDSKEGLVGSVTAGRTWELAWCDGSHGKFLSVT